MRQQITQTLLMLLHDLPTVENQLRQPNTRQLRRRVLLAIPKLLCGLSDASPHARLQIIDALHSFVQLPSWMERLQTFCRVVDNAVVHRRSVAATGPVNRRTPGSSIGTPAKTPSVNNSAAALGVAARKSATKSLIVKSISWPTAETTGNSELKIARATTSSLNAQRSSKTATAACYQNQIQFWPLLRPFVEQSNRSRNFITRSLALHRAGCENDFERRIAATNHVQHVTNCCASWRCYETNSSRVVWNLTLAFRGEQSFRIQLLFQLFKRNLQCTDAMQFNIEDVELILAASS